MLVLAEVHARDGFPLNWPDQREWLSRGPLLGSWVAELEGGLVGHVSLSRGGEGSARLGESSEPNGDRLHKPMNEGAHPDGLPTEVLEDVASVVGTEITLLSRLPGGINAGATRVQLAEGVNAEVTFHPRMENVVSYTYRIENGPEQTLSAGTDGTAATTFTFDKPGSYTVYFRSTDSSGYTTLEDEAPIWVQEPYEDPGDPF